MLWIFDISCLLKALLKVFPFNGAEVNTGDELGNVYHFSQPPSILGIWATEPCYDATNSYCWPLFFCDAACKFVLFEKSRLVDDAPVMGAMHV